jgi:hypothetical protein
MELNRFLIKAIGIDIDAVQAFGTAKENAAAGTGIRNASFGLGALRSFDWLR